MLGDGPEKNKAEKKAKKLGIKEKVIFFGKSNEINKILSFSDLFLLPSEIESFGLSALEAMAANVPVVSSNTGGIPEVNIDNFSGKLSDIGNVNKMINDSVLILSDNKIHKKFKQNARKRAEEFDIHKIVPLYEKVYKKLI
jgi:glycosyltransferase involved in cell wall biosynthesis